MIVSAEVGVLSGAAINTSAGRQRVIVCVRVIISRPADQLDCSRTGFLFAGRAERMIHYATRPDLMDERARSVLYSAAKRNLLAQAAASALIWSECQVRKSVSERKVNHLQVLNGIFCDITLRAWTRVKK